MATIRAYTTIEQSRKLAEILPLESADMYYFRQINNGYFSPDVEFIYHIPLFKDGKEDFNYDIRCWSLSALLDVLPKRIKECNVLRIDIDEKDFAIWYDEVGYGVNNDLPNITMESAIDACYEMIIRLHEQKIL